MGFFPLPGRGRVGLNPSPCRTCSSESAESPEAAPGGAPPPEQPAVIPTQGDLLGDLLNLDLGPPVSGPPVATSSVQMGAVDLLGGGLDSLVSPIGGGPDSGSAGVHLAAACDLARETDLL